MKERLITMKIKILLICLLIIAISIVSVSADEKKGTTILYKPTTLGLIERMSVNNIDIPLENNGGIGDDGKSYYPSGQTSLSFLFAGGFGTSGYVNGELRASWMAPASLIEEWQPGTFTMDPTDPLAKFYVVDKTDGFGSQPYIDWADAVSMGAEFQDLNGDGMYDPNVDRPDMLGDKIIWCPLSDQTDLAIRAGGLATDPLDLEVHQHVWAFARSDELGDVVFLRYRLINPSQNNIDDLIFTVVEDPDLGDHLDDRIGCDTVFVLPAEPGADPDTVKSLGFIYNDGTDGQYGANPPAFGVDFFQGPVVSSPGDTAYLYRGPFFGIDTVADFRNLGMTSFMYYIQSNAIIGDPDNADIARYYQEGGRDQEGLPIDPTAWGTGGTASTDPRFVFSGDPTDGPNGSGWLDITPDDKRFMVNCGPFQLAAGDTQDIVVGYVVAQGTDALNSLDKLRKTDVVAQAAYNANFEVAGPPPAPKVTVRSFDQKVELIIDLESTGTGSYDQLDKLNNKMVFEAINVYQFQSENPGNFVGSVENAKIIKQYDIDNQYGTIYATLSDGTVEKIWDGQNNISPESFADSGSAVIKLTIDQDVFNNNDPLINNTHYYFAVTAFALNHNKINPYLSGDNWIVNGTAHFLESPRSAPAAFVEAIPGASEYSPFNGKTADYDGSRQFHDGIIYVDVVEKDSVNGHEYLVTFSDEGELWYLHDLTSPDTLLDSMTYQAVSSEEWNFPIVDGVSVKVVNVPDRLDTALVTSGVSWIVGNPGTVFDTTATFDDGISFVKFEKPTINNNTSTFTNDRYFPVLIDFDTTFTGKAYQYRANYNLFTASNDVRVRAFDVSDPSSPRQLNIVYLSNTADLNFTAHEVLIMDSDYQPDNAYSTRPDSAFMADAYLIMDLRPANANIDTVFTSEFELTIYPNYPNSDLDQFRFSTSDLVTPLTVTERKDKLENVKVVPNPYFAYSRYETSYDTPVLRFTHLEPGATVRIFNLAGQLVKILEHTEEFNELDWDLRNEAGLKIASGMYIAHVEVPGVGEKILKFAVVQREERIDRY